MMMMMMMMICSITIRLLSILIYAPCLLVYGFSNNYQIVESTTRRHNYLVNKSIVSLSLQGNDKIFNDKVYETIQSGKISVIPNFLDAQEISFLRQDAQQLHEKGFFSTDALASYGTSGKFDPAKDRAVLRLNNWKNQIIGNYNTRSRFGNRMAAVRSDLAYHLNRPHLNDGLSTTAFGNGSTEISYTRFCPGAYLKRHVDEHHEELKGRDGWSKPTRRSISWLIYLNDDWEDRKNGGQLRCYERSSVPSSNLSIGAKPNGDLQIGWLVPSALDPVERPVFLNSRLRGGEGGNCAMYIDVPGGRGSNEIKYITKRFDSHPSLYVAGAEILVRRLLIDQRDLADRFRLIEAPKSPLVDFFRTNAGGAGVGKSSDELIADVSPNGGTLVMFDSVSLPHEVMPTIDRERWATSGWFHEDQQPLEGYEV